MNAKKEMIRFPIAGAIITATDFGIYYLLFHFLSFSISKGISFTCAGIVGYLLNKYWTFKHNQPSYAEIGRYALVNFLALGINVLINQLQVILIVRKYSEVLFVSGVYVTYHKIISQVRGVLGCIVPVLYIVMILFN